MINLGIVILNYNNYSDTIKCLESIFNIDEESIDKIVIVDNHSTDDSVNHIQNFLSKNENNKSVKRTELIPNDKNYGYARGNNIGIKYLISKKAKYITVINSDIIFFKKIFDKLVSKLKNDSKIAFISPVIYDKLKNVDFNCIRYNTSSLKLICDTFFNTREKESQIESEETTCDILSGAFLMASAQTWRDINYFDENTFLYYEENIIYEKLKLINKKSVVLKNCSVMHYGGKSTAKIKNTVLLTHQKESLIYYLGEYKRLSYAFLVLVNFIFELKIKIIQLKK